MSDDQFNKRFRMGAMISTEMHYEILDLRAERAKLEAALRPFAEAGKRLPDVWRDHETHWTNWEQSLTAGNLRAARDALAQPAESGAGK